jgi:hypothetical protein
MSRLSYVRLTVYGKISRIPIGCFPTYCPNCNYPWQPKKNSVFHASPMSGGRQATCRVCGCQMVEFNHSEYDWRLAGFVNDDA